jgi:putative endonuclease
VALYLIQRPASRRVSLPADSTPLGGSFMQFYVYALYSSSTDKIYVGQTKDMVQRLDDHQRGYSPYTSRVKDWELFHKEIFPDRSSALKRETQ